MKGKSILGIALGFILLGTCFFASVVLPTLAVIVDSTADIRHESTMNQQAHETGSDRITSEDVTAAKNLSAKEVTEWQEKYPSLLVGSDQEARERIIILKRHPDWKPVDFEEVAGIYSDKYETACYRFETSDTSLFADPEDTVYKDVPYLVVEPQ